MSSKKFEKDSVEWALFRDFYRLCTDHWELDAEDMDTYYQNMTQDAKTFFHQYENKGTFDKQFVEDLSKAVINLAIRKEQEMNKERTEKVEEPELELAM